MPSSFSVALFFILGAIFGSYANVLIYRVPKGENTVTSRSHCPKCQHLISWYDNIPLLSWLFLGGRCRRCKGKISFRYFIVELLMAILFAGLWVKIGWKFTLLEYLVLAFGLVVVSFIDLDHMILPDRFTLSGIVIGIVGSFINPERSWEDALLGILFGGGFLWAVAYFYLLLRKQEGLGGGDIKLLAWIGAVLGWKPIPFIILSSSLVGTLVGIFVMLRSKSGLKTIIPFGPYIALGALIYIFWGQEIAEWYLHIFIPYLSPVN
ncbi:MAG: prepilin peptidase [Bdellovibrio sp.]|nr:MAG: prepilin peptidase [Bdellovibrio sp.]